ncbi:MAG TPA: hypothetical protein VGF29_16980 [Hyphomicrobiaceae bacterium]|jgi:hypothetical protein
MDTDTPSSPPAKRRRGRPPGSLNKRSQGRLLLGQTDALGERGREFLRDIANNPRAGPWGQLAREALARHRR